MLIFKLSLFSCCMGALVFYSRPTAPALNIHTRFYSLLTSSSLGFFMSCPLRPSHSGINVTFSMRAFPAPTSLPIFFLPRFFSIQLIPSDLTEIWICFCCSCYRLLSFSPNENVNSIESVNLSFVLCCVSRMKIVSDTSLVFNKEAMKKGMIFYLQTL